MKPVLLVAGIILIVAFCIGCHFSNSGSDMPQTVSYNFDVRPILSDKCYSCHGPDKTNRQAGLRLDIADSALAPLKETKGAYAIVPGKPEISELVKRVKSTDPDYQMPTPDSHLGILTEREIELLTAWVKQGAKFEKHWAYISPKKSKLPEVSNKQWTQNEIDYFTLSKMEENDLEPNSEADKEALLKRVSLDATGLLPSVKMMDEFLNDKSANAYEKMLDRVLNTPQYGEKMALYWIDIARYSDSYGYQDDNIRTQWPYRDWVIHAFNNNMPYDKFITWQIAGDLLPGATKEQILATAFLRNHKYTEEGGVIPEEYRVEYVVDKVKTYSKGLLGMTVECAQCHDHRYDPISQKDYFGVFAFFNSSKETGFEGDVSISKPAKTPVLNLTKDDITNTVSFINHKDTGMLSVSVMEELDTIRATHLLHRGVYDQPREVITPSPLPAVMDFDTTKYTRNRLGLAMWTVSKDNPLTARVFVNQIWQELFGRGIVKTTGDFGMQGNLPSHPELLDWLARDFVEHNWDVKYLIKKILLSATYRQSSKITQEHLSKDPENIYMAHAPRYRVKAEIVKDIVLSASGLLNPVIGGPSVKPYQPKGLWESATSGRGALAVYRQDSGNDLYRRGIYTFIKLTVPPPSMIIFDASNRDQCEVKRTNTNTPLQALVMMNDPAVLEASRVLAQKLVKQNTSADENLRLAFRRIIARNPSDKEMKILGDYYKDQVQLFQSGKLKAGELLEVGEYPQEEGIDKNKTAALMKIVSTIFNMEEAITKI